MVSGGTNLLDERSRDDLSEKEPALAKTGTVV